MFTMKPRINCLFILFAGIALGGGAVAQEHCPQFVGQWNRRYVMPDEFYFGKGRGEKYAVKCEPISPDDGGTRYNCDGAIVHPERLIFEDKSGQERAWVVQESEEAAPSCGETADGMYYYQMVKTVEWLTVKDVRSSPVFTRVYYDYNYYAKRPKLDM